MELCYDGTLVMPSNYVSVGSSEMEYIDGGALSNSDKAWIVGIAIVSAVAIGAAIWVGAWAVAAKIFGVGLKLIMVKAGAAAVVSTLVACLAISSTAAWNIVNYFK